MAYAPRAGGQPVIVLKEGTTRTRGKAAQRNNIAAAKIIAEIVRTTLGPKGMDKILVDSIGDVDNTVGDGTTTVVILAGELLKRAGELIEQKIHPSTIIRGYKRALDIALQHLDKIARPVKLEDKETLKKILLTSLGSKSLGFAKEHIANLALEAVLRIIEPT